MTDIAAFYQALKDNEDRVRKIEELKIERDTNKKAQDFLLELLYDQIQKDLGKSQAMKVFEEHMTESTQSSIFETTLSEDF